MSTRKNAARADIDLVTDEVEEQPNHNMLASISTSVSTENLCDRSEPNQVLSKKRWFILVAMCVFGLSQSIQSISSIFKKLLELLDLHADTYLYIDLVFDYLITILALPSAAFVDKFGTRIALHLASCLLVISSIFTSLLYFTFIPGWHHYKMYYYILAGAIKMEVTIIFFLLPLKIAESWFAESERSFAWMLMILQMDIANCVVSFVYPRMITKVTDFEILAYISIVSSAITLLTSIGLVTKSEPERPPSKRAALKDNVPFFQSVKRILRRKDILIHQIHSSIFASISITFSKVLQDILLSIGQSQIFAGNYMAINGVISMVMSITMSSFVHKVHNKTLACKIGSLFQAVGFVALLLACRASAPSSVLITTSVALTCFRSWTVPHFNEMTANLITGVVSQAKIVGLSLIMVPLLSSIDQLAFAYLIVTKEDSKKEDDYHKSLLLLIGVCVANELFYQMFFHGEEDPIESESGHQANEVEQQNNLQQQHSDDFRYV